MTDPSFSTNRATSGTGQSSCETDQFFIHLIWDLPGRNQPLSLECEWPGKKIGALCDKKVLPHDPGAGSLGLGFA